MSSPATALEVVRQFVANFERKQRNLMKRKSKLDLYREQLNRGELLNEEQKKAVESYEGVLQSLNVVQEVLMQSKDLVSDVEKCSKIEELQKEEEHERYTVSFLHTHICLMRLLNSLDHQEVRTAVAKASSENNLKLLDIVRNLVLPAVPDNWPSSASNASSNISEFLQSNSELKSASRYTMQFVLGKPVPVPIPADFDGPHKKLNFKEARNICFRLLASRSVRLSIEASSRACPLIPQVQAEYTGTAQDPPSSTHDDFQPNPEPMVGGLHPPTTALSVENPPVTSNRIDPPVPTILDQVIRPLGGTFNFLQASSVMASDPLIELSPPCTEVHPGHSVDHPVQDTVENHTAAPNGRYASPSSPAPTADVLFNVEAKIGLGQSLGIVSTTTGKMPQETVEPEVSISSKPISYADLVRRVGCSRPTHQQEHYASGTTHEPKEPILSHEAHAAYDTGNAENGTGPNLHRPGRGSFRGATRGSSGTSRRAVGASRWNRPGAGTGRGGGGPYRHSSQSVAQPSY